MGTTNDNVLTAIHCSCDQPRPEESKISAHPKKKRHVRFLNDALVSDYLEPFRPVPDSCTSDELIAAYVGSCFHYKVQPIAFLLEQLRGIDLSICNERYSRLSLRGVRLNRPQVETLEEVFKRVHFRELDFEDTYLDEQSATAFFDMLLHYETCNELKVTLNLDRNNPGQAWSHCVTFLRRSDQLNRFRLSHTPLTVDNFLGMSFFGLSTESLSLRDCNLSGQTLFGLVRWLRLLLTSSSLEPPDRDRVTTSAHAHKRLGTPSSRCRRRVKCLDRFVPNQTNFYQPPVWDLKLDLSSNRMTPSDAETLLMLVRHQLLVPTLPCSYFEYSKFSARTTSIDEDTGETEPATTDLLPIGGIGFLMELDVSNNNLGDDGLRILCTGLLQRNRMRLKQLRSHDKSGSCLQNNGTTSSSCLSERAGNANDQVAFRARGLERLSLARNNLTSSGMQAMAFVLMQTPPSLTHLIGGLISLDLSHNPAIRDDGVELLCTGLIRNHSLKELYLRSVRMSFAGIFALSGFLCESKCLQVLDIRGNQIDLASLMAVSKTLAINHTLTSFFSDARALANSDSLLVATDMELILWLIDEIESCLRRNRMHAETQATSAPTNDPPENADSAGVTTAGSSTDSDSSSNCLSSHSVLKDTAPEQCNLCHTSETWSEDNRSDEQMCSLHNAHFLFPREICTNADDKRMFSAANAHSDGRNGGMVDDMDMSVFDVIIDEPEVSDYTPRAQSSQLVDTLGKYAASPDTQTDYSCDCNRSHSDPCPFSLHNSSSDASSVAAVSCDISSFPNGTSQPVCQLLDFTSSHFHLGRCEDNSHCVTDSIADGASSPPNSIPTFSRRSRKKRSKK